MSDAGNSVKQTAEGQRLFSERSVRKNAWRKWGPYLSERQWGTVREDYSADGSAWDSFSHDDARFRAYRWGEDGLAGISDDHQLLCFAFSFWNRRDPILKERLFGLTGNQGNHGEDVKEVYHYVDNTPTHSYMKYRYRYTQSAFPYAQLVQENARRKCLGGQPEFELVDTVAFDGNRYFDIDVEYAKRDADDILVQVTVNNRGPETADLVVLPTLWFRNIWSWGLPGKTRPVISLQPDGSLLASSAERDLGEMFLYTDGRGEALFCENETNLEHFSWGSNGDMLRKDGINACVVNGLEGCVRHDRGTKASFCHDLSVPAGGARTIRLRLCRTAQADPFAGADDLLRTRKGDADEFYDALFQGRSLHGKPLDEDARRIARQAYAGMLWSKQFFHYIVEDWLEGDPKGPKPPESRKQGRNSDWTTLYNEDVITMPDKWEYPWFATWDLAFHTVSFAAIDPDFAKHQLRLFTCEWYMHPNGQLPAYEWNFDDVNPPVHAWAAWRVFQTERDLYGEADVNFLSRVHAKLLMYFTWWINRKDSEGNNLFEGGFLGLDNISAIDRSHLDLAGNAVLEQSDGTTWVGIFCLNMLRISLELARQEGGSERGSVNTDLAYKFFQHFLLIARAFNSNLLGLWDDGDGFYYDVLKVPRSTVAGDTYGLPDPVRIQMKLRSMVGLLPIAAVETITLKPDELGSSDFLDRIQWFLDHRPDLTGGENACVELAKSSDGSVTVHLSLVGPERLRKILGRMLDPSEFRSPYGIRSLSKVYEHFPYELPYTLLDRNGNGIRPTVRYCPAESDSGMFGGNSNWRGPVWMPVNVVLIEALRRHLAYLGKGWTVSVPSATGGPTRALDLGTLADEISGDLIAIFARGADGRRPVFGGPDTKYQTDPDWHDDILFYEYFHGDNGAGIGASHQTGWTGQIANLILGV